jgi:serine/threonine protein kinase
MGGGCIRLVGSDAVALVVINRGNRSSVAKPAVKSFGKYQILERIATGGMAEIYRARLEGIGGFQRTFAIKRILPNLSQNEEYIAMLVDEAKVAGLLSHANIVQILDLGQVDGVWYIAMEFVDGRDIGKVLRGVSAKGLCLPVPHAVFITIELLKGLDYAHQRQVMRGGRPVPLNIVHRDVSPPNILVSFQGEVKLTDFGIARASLKMMETVSGVVKGRFDYMSPEQAAGRKDLDQRSDLFSVGVVLYEMLTGRHPFRAPNEIATVERIRTGAYDPVSVANPEVPLTLETIVARALRSDRNERYPSAAAFKEALDKFFHESGFIFNQATLSAYVRNLFPKGDTRSQPKATPKVDNKHEPRTDDDIQLETMDLDDSDYPTNMVDQSVVDAEMRRAGTASGRFGLRHDDNELSLSRPLDTEPVPLDILAADEQETLVGHSEWDDDLETVVAGSVEWADEQETVVRRSPFDEQSDTWTAEEKLTPEPKKAQAPPPPKSTPVPAKSTPAPVVSLPPDSQSMEQPKASNSIGWLGWMMTFAGLGLGTVGGAVFAGSISAIVWGTVPVPPSTLRVEAPQRTAVTVNGDNVSKRVVLEPNTAHSVKVKLPGQAPWEDSIVLAPGEVRVLSFILTNSAADGDTPQ